MLQRKTAIPLLAAVALTIVGCASLARDGRRLLEAGQYEAAVDRFGRHLETHPDDWKSRERLGYAYLKSGRYPEAIQAFEGVRRMKPDPPDTLLYLGLAYLRDGRLEAGIGAWRDFIDVGGASQVSEVRRMLTLLEMAESRKFTADAIAGQPNPAPRGTGRRFGVLYFNDLSAEKGLRAVQKSLAAMVIHDLSLVEGLRVVSRMRMDALLDAVGFKQTGLVVEADIPEIGRLLGVDDLVFGTLSTLLRDLRVNTMLTAVPVGSKTDTFLYSDPLDRFYELQKKVVFTILERAGHPLRNERRKQLGKPHTEDFDAFLLFGRGLEALDAGEWDTAKLFFEKAIDADSGFKLAKEALDVCPAGLGIPFEPVTRMGIDESANRMVTDRLETIVEKLASFPR